MKGFKPMVKMQTGGFVETEPGQGLGQPSGPMGVAAPNSKMLPGSHPPNRIGYKNGKKVRNAK